MKTSFFPPLIGAAALLLGGCATGPVIRTHSDPVVNYAAYHTFALGEQKLPSNPEMTPVVLRSINEETVAAFQRAGLTLVSPGTPSDVIVIAHSHDSVSREVEIVDWGYGWGRFRPYGFWGPGPGWGWGPGWGGWWGPPPGGYYLERYREGSLIIDVVDARTRQLVWRGVATDEITGPPDASKIRAAIDRIVSQYPH